MKRDTLVCIFSILVGYFILGIFILISLLSIETLGMTGLLIMPLGAIIAFGGFILTLEYFEDKEYEKFLDLGAN